MRLQEWSPFLEALIAEDQVKLRISMLNSRRRQLSVQISVIRPGSTGWLSNTVARRGYGISLVPEQAQAEAIAPS
jgi:hypothetical protein